MSTGRLQEFNTLPIKTTVHLWWRFPALSQKLCPDGRLSTSAAYSGLLQPHHPVTSVQTAASPARLTVGYSSHTTQSHWGYFGAHLCRSDPAERSPSHDVTSPCWRVRSRALIDTALSGRTRRTSYCIALYFSRWDRKKANDFVNWRHIGYHEDFGPGPTVQKLLDNIYDDTNTNIRGRNDTNIRQKCARIRMTLCPGYTYKVPDLASIAHPPAISFCWQQSHCLIL